MIGQAQFVNGIWMGIVLIALGLLPVLLQSLTDSLRKFIGTNSPVAIPTRLRNQTQQVPLKQQPWLAMLGAAIIAASFALYLAK
jgi:hypothetical protein